MINKFEIKCEGKRAKILLYAPIGPDFWGDGSRVSAIKFAQEVNALKGIEGIDLHINSPGGSVFDATAMFNTLKNKGVPVAVHIDGVALSAATIVMMAGTTVRMAKGAMLMIHDPSSYAEGNAADFRSQADLLDKVRDNIIDIYASKVTSERSKISEQMTAETWFTAKEAKDAGFVDAIDDAPVVVAGFNIEQFSKAPDWVKTVAAQWKEPLATEETKPMSQPVETPVETPVAAATNVTITPPPAAPVTAVVNIDEITATAKAEGAAIERKRVSDITAMCVAAHMPDAAAKMIEAGTTIADAKDQLFHAMCNKNAPVGALGGESPVAPVKAEDKANAAKIQAFRDEFRAEAKLHKATGVTEEQYVAHCCSEIGIDYKPAN